MRQKLSHLCNLTLVRDFHSQKMPFHRVGIYKIPSFGVVLEKWQVQGKCKGIPISEKNDYLNSKFWSTHCITFIEVKKDAEKPKK